MARHAQSIISGILKRIRGHGRGYVFTPRAFLDLGSRAAVDQALSRLVQAGEIRRIRRGLYDYPKTHAALGVLAPSVEDVLTAMLPEGVRRLQRTGADAANLLGLTTQVPAHNVFLTEGPTRTIHVDKRSIRLRHCAPRYFALGSYSALVVQALRWLGRRNVDAYVLGILRDKLAVVDQTQFIRELRHAPAWIADVLRPILQLEGH